MTTDTDKRLAEIRERAEKATEGPWRMRPKTHDDWGYIRSPDDSFVAIAKAGTFLSDLDFYEHRFNKTDPTQHNADFIAHSRADIPFLLAEIDRMKGERVELAGFAFSHGVTYGSDQCHEMPEWWNPDDAPGSILTAYLQSKQEKMG